MRWKIVLFSFALLNTVNHDWSTWPVGEVFGRSSCHPGWTLSGDRLLFWALQIKPARFIPHSFPTHEGEAGGHLSLQSQNFLLVFLMKSKLQRSSLTTLVKRRWQRKLPKSVLHVQGFSFCFINMLPFYFLLSVIIIMVASSAPDCK